MKFSLYIFCISSFCLFSGCDKRQKPNEVLKSNNSDYEVCELFELNESKVYRFSDNGKLVYIVLPKGSCQWTNTTRRFIRAGKSMTSIPTHHENSTYSLGDKDKK